MSKPSAKIVPSLWYAREAEEAARFYATVFPDSRVDRVTALAKEAGATPYMVLLAAFGVLLQRYTHSDDFLVATPVLNRTAVGDTTASMIRRTVSRSL